MPEKMNEPRWAHRLLQKFANPDTLEEVEGDLQEFMSIWEARYGIGRARLKHIVTVFTLLRPFHRKKYSVNNNDSMTMINSMLWSYLKISWRNILKNKVSSVINISGLTLGLATSLIIFLVVNREFQYDRFHSNLPDIHTMMKNQSTDDGIATGNSTPGPLAEALKADFPEVVHTFRVAPFDSKLLLTSDNRSYEDGIYADPDLFKTMTFQVIEGDALKTLESNSGIVITKDMARKLFGEENSIGETVQFDGHHSLTVGAVIENVPSASSIRFNMVVPFSILEKESEWINKWDDNRIATWMQLRSLTDLPAFNKKITQLLQDRSNDKTVSLFAYPLSELYLYGSFSNGVPNGGRITGIKLLIGFGIFMLLIACINFMNIATAQSEHRAKEVGVRKVLGASRKWIILQFLNESFLTTFLSLITATIITLAIIPAFNSLTHSAIEFDLTNRTTWVSAVCIGIATALLAGSYPALFLSRFIPVRVLKGRVATGKGGGLRRALVTFQFSISIFVLISTIIMYAQFDHVQSRPIGYDQSNLINIDLDSTLTAKFEYLKDEVLKLPTVNIATGTSGNILYSGGAVTGMDWPGKKPGQELSVVVMDVEYAWSKTMGVKMVHGRDFDPAFPSDLQGCIINQSAMTKMGLENPIGSMVGGRPVIGVFQDYVYNNPFGSVAPMALYLNPKHSSHLYLRVQNNSGWHQTVDAVESITKKISPDFPFRASFTSEEYQHHFEEISNTGLMISVFGGMTIFISCFGLFGLSGFVAEKRSKEMSVRKVFGATACRILLSLSKDFLKPVLYALLIVIPMTIVIAQRVLSTINYRVTLSWWMFAAGAMLILSISSIIVLYQGWKTASVNPIVQLRNE